MGVVFSEQVKCGYTQKNIQYIIAAVDFECDINKLTSSFREQNVVIPALGHKYQDLREINEQCLKILPPFSSSKSSDFMVDCYDVIDPHFKDLLLTGTHVKAHVLGDKTYLTFGPEKIKVADLYVQFQLVHKTAWQQGIDELLALEEGVLNFHKTLSPITLFQEVKRYSRDQLRQKMMTYNKQIDVTACLLKRSDLGDDERAHHNKSFAFFLKQAKTLQDQARYYRPRHTKTESYEALISAEEERVETLRALSQVADQLEDFWIDNLPYCNKITLLRNPALND